MDLVKAPLNTFYLHADFSSGKHITWILHYNSEKDKNVGFLSFLRLVGCLYFKKHYSAVVSLKSIETPQQLLNSFPLCSQTADKQHKAWYTEIRSIVSDGITNKEDRMPSVTSLWQHWLRACYVARMWQNLKKTLYYALPEPEECGWQRNESGGYTIDWECPKVQRRVTNTIQFLIKGCSCKKGCHNNQCSCRKKGNTCGPGCQCHGCVNTGAADSHDNVHRDRIRIWNRSNRDRNRDLMYPGSVVVHS